MIERILTHRGAAALAGQPIGAARHFPRPERHDRQRGDYFQRITKQIEAAGGNAEIAKAIVESIVDLAKLYTDPKAENAADTPTEIGGLNIGSFSS